MGPCWMVQVVETFPEFAPPSTLTNGGAAGSPSAGAGAGAGASTSVGASASASGGAVVGPGSGRAGATPAEVAAAVAALTALGDLEEAPFTLQRLCEVLTEPTRFYKRKRKLVSAVQRVRVGVWGPGLVGAPRWR